MSQFQLLLKQEVGGRNPHQDNGRVSDPKPRYSAMWSLKRKTSPFGAPSANLPSSPPPNEIQVFSDSKLPWPPPSPVPNPHTDGNMTSSTFPGSCLPTIHDGSSITSTRTSLGPGLLSR